ncbi:MAG: winged helix-turn-helix domain-containing protein [Candidatus Micrarchaeia archaeon]
MRNLLPLALLALLAAPLAFASSASFSTGAASLPERVEMAGHFGNYTLLAYSSGGSVTVAVSGEGESYSALAAEIEWLSQNGKLYTVCDIGAMPALPEPYCNMDGKWEGEEAALPAQAPAPAQDSWAGRLTMAGAQKASSEAAAGAPSQVGTEQVLQLLGAFLAIIVASYLILHGRQEPLLDAAAEKLLDNPTRAGIMNELSEADRIPTDISARLGKSKAAVVEHLAALSEAGLVERMATPGKKFVFYKLTQKGRQALLKKAG